MDHLIRGYFDDEKRSLVRLRVRGKNGWSILTTEIDTGAQPALVTSLAWASALDAEIESKHIATLANGAIVPAFAMAVELEWCGQVVVVIGIAFSDADAKSFIAPGKRGRGANALIGRELLHQSRLTIDYVDGTVLIDTSAARSSLTAA
jgi:predicted aspartyl protease